MLFFSALLLGAQFSAVLALPLPHNSGSNSVAVALSKAHAAMVVSSSAASSSAASSSAASSSAASSTSSAATATATAKADEEEKEDELDVAGKFDTKIELGGGDVKTDVLFTKSATGSLEVEFQDKNANTLTVKENKTPAPPPAGFMALDSSSYIISLEKGAANLTLQKVDYVLDVNSSLVQSVDASQGQIGKLCTDTNTFIIDPALGEFEFEDDDNELSLTVTNMIGEWGIFIPTSAVKANNTASEEGEDELDVTGVFDKAIEVSGGNKKTDILFTKNVAGALEVEFNGTAANAITVKQKTPTASPPSGFIFVDSNSYVISTKNATSKATDIVKVDYIFTPEVAALVDASKGRVGKLDTKTNAFVVENVGEFEFEEDENEWSLTVPDLNGEWALLIPSSALL